MTPNLKQAIRAATKSSPGGYTSSTRSPLFAPHRLSAFAIPPDCSQNLFKLNGVSQYSITEAEIGCCKSLNYVPSSGLLLEVIEKDVLYFVGERSIIGEKAQYAEHSTPFAAPCFIHRSRLSDWSVADLLLKQE